MTDLNMMQFEMGHLDFMKPLETHGDMEAVKKALKTDNPTYNYTFMYNGEPLGALFSIMPTPKTIQIWAVVSVNCKKYPVVYHRNLKKVLNWMEVTLGVERIQSLIDVDNEVALKQHKRLGFEIEGMTRKSGLFGQDQYIMGRVK